ncbi:rhomboid family intramembrane serine protease [Dyella japonica]|uniref:Membrane associated rhomboid family serine protease n=1 Tax=Dyella japonica TaxID=231455 RepID=A0ABV2K1C6_9GAMM
MTWRTDSAFPRANGKWAFWRPPFGKVTSGQAEVIKATRQWNPWDSILVSSPSSTHLLPPVCIPDLTVTTQKRMLLQYKLLLGLVAAMLFASFLFYLHKPVPYFIRTSLAMVVTLLFIAAQYFIVFRTLPVLQSTARFISWMHLQRTYVVPTVIFVMMVSGLLELAGIHEAGGFESFILKYGLVFDKAKIEPWRYFIGPFFHSGLPHWAGNTVALVIAASITSVISKRATTLWVFLIGLIIPVFVVSCLPASARLDAFGGVSGGILSLFGWLAGTALRYHKWFPRNFWLIAVLFAWFLIVLSGLLNPSTNDVVHVIGWFLGAIVGGAGIGFSVTASKRTYHPCGWLPPPVNQT